MPARPTVQAQGQTFSKRTLLDEVNVIMSVSGGSFTAAYYGLHGKDIFKSFREAFLLRDVQGALFWKVTPINRSVQSPFLCRKTGKCSESARAPAGDMRCRIGEIAR